LIIPIVTVAEFDPSMLAMIIVLTFNNLLLAQVNKSVVTVVPKAPFILFPSIEVAATMFGFAILFSYVYPQTIAIAIDLDLVGIEFSFNIPVIFTTVSLILTRSEPPVFKVIASPPIFILRHAELPLS